MTVSELIKKLQSLKKPNAPVYFAYDYGDRVHHMCANEVIGVSVKELGYSSYVNGYTLDPDDISKEDESNPPIEEAIVLQNEFE